MSETLMNEMEQDYFVDEMFEEYDDTRGYSRLDADGDDWQNEGVTA